MWAHKIRIGDFLCLHWREVETSASAALQLSIACLISAHLVMSFTMYDLIMIFPLVPFQFVGN